LTDAKIKAIRPQAKRYVVWEDGGTGMGIRIFPSGKRSFVFMYRFEGKARMMTLGSYPNIGLATARTKVAESKEKVTQGIDPGAKWLEIKHNERTAHTIKALVEEYLEKWARPRKKSWKEDERVLRKDVVPKWGRKKAKDIKRRDVVLLLDEIMGRGAPIQANMTYAIIRKMFNFAVGRSILDTSPCVAIPSPAKPKRRDRVLNEDEIKQFWKNLDAAKMADGTRWILKLILITAQRKGEIAGAEWKEFDLKRGWWIIPAERAKNKLPHRVPLTKLALEYLHQVKELSKDSPWIFPSPINDCPVTGPGIDHAVRKNREIFKIDHFVPHDLRRTAASQMTSLGISRLVVAKILNHSESGVTAVYDRYSYDKEKIFALNKWEKKLKGILEDL